MNTITTKLLILCLLSPFFGSSQYSDDQLAQLVSTSSNEKLVLESSRLLVEDYFIDAEKLVDKLLEKNPSVANYNYRKGFILSEGRGDFKQAIPYLELATKNVSKNFDLFSAKEQSAAVESFYHLAKSYHRTGSLEKARENYTIFLSQAIGSSDFTIYSEIALKQIKTAQKLIEFPKTNVEVRNMGSTINSELPEYAPVVSIDGAALYYTTRRPWDDKQKKEDTDPRYGFYPEDIYVSYRNLDNTWSKPNRLEFCKSDQNEASVSVSLNEQRIYVYQDNAGNGNMFYSEFNTNKFKSIESFTSPEVNSQFWETHCFVTPDGKNMYFTSDRPGGYGGRDIYCVTKLPDGSWGQTRNLGPKINSASDEEAPFMSLDNKSLYFASNGETSMGGFDIFVTFANESGVWSDPVNLGYPVNSTEDDLFYTETSDGRRGYITSKRADGKGEKDIYEIENDYLSSLSGTTFKGKIITKNNAPLPKDVSMKLACIDCSETKETTSYPRNEDGVFISNLEPCHSYTLSFSQQDGAKEIYSETLSTACEKKQQEIYREVFLDVDRMAITMSKDTNDVIAATKDPENNTTNNTTNTTPNTVNFTSLEMKHFFSYNAAKLTTQEGELKNFITSVDKQLADGKKEITIEINSSASNVPTTTFKTNQSLAQTRANNMKNELESYYKSSPYANKVKVVIKTSSVSGPSYKKDALNTSKYEPYQFISLKTK